MALQSYVIKSLPKGEDYQSLVNSFLGSQLMLVNDFAKSKSLIITDDTGLCTRMRNCVPGFDCAEDELPKLENPEALIVFSSGIRSAEKGDKVEVIPLFSELYGLLAGQDVRLCLSLVKADPRHLHFVKERVEEALSTKGVRLTTSSGGRGAEAHSLHSELFYGSDERSTLTSMLEMIGEISALNGSSYKVMLIMDGDKRELRDFLKSKVLVINSTKLGRMGFNELYNSVKDVDAIPLDYKSIGQLLFFSNSISRRARIATQEPHENQKGMEIGTFLKDSISESRFAIRIDKSTLNLGAIITGLPGTGKTFAAMSLLSKLSKPEKNKTSTVIITPTKEWGEFARLHGLPIVKIYGSGIPINFFRCANENLKDKFSENLAMLIASASSAGPYQSSLEKCLLAAFRRIYSRELCPDPVELYGQIEEVVIEQHAKRSNTGVKYTKHGENIKAALQNLRLMLFRPEFASTIGIDLNEIFQSGVVFDLSDVSGNMKQLFYALILNQLYAFLDTFDEKGNEMLRIEIALEEAQLIFSPDEDSPAVIDLKQRIQDFRKRGIGLMLITHSVTDITPSIRRMCQNKFYFRQSADLAKYALQDLGLDSADMDALSRIRNLEQGCCALLYLENEEMQKLPQGPVFAKIYGKIEANPNALGKTLELQKSNLICGCTVALINNENKPIQNQKIELSYLGETFATGQTDNSGEIKFEGLILGKRYTCTVMGAKKKELREYRIIPEPEKKIILQVVENAR